MHMFPSVKVPFQVLIQTVDRVQPRLYTIASSSSVSPDRIHLAAEILKVKTPEGKIKTGLCS